MKQSPIKNKAREVLWLAIPNRYFRDDSRACLNRGIFSIPWRHFMLSFIIAYGNLWDINLPS